MLVDRKRLIEHLKKVNCDGLLKDVVLTDRFAASGFSTSQDLLLVAGPREWASPLPNEVGVVNLELLIKVLDIGEDEKISFDVNETHITLETNDRVIRLVTASPRVIGSRADSHLVDKVLRFIPPTAKWTPLGLRLVSGVQEAISKLGADNVLLFVSPKGSRVVVGEERANSVLFQFPDLTGGQLEEYKLTFHSSLISSVLKQVSDFTKAEIALSGKDSTIAIREGEYVFFLSPAKEV